MLRYVPISVFICLNDRGDLQLITQSTKSRNYTSWLIIYLPVKYSKVFYLRDQSSFMVGGGGGGVAPKRNWLGRKNITQYHQSWVGKKM